MREQGPETKAKLAASIPPKQCKDFLRSPLTLNSTPVFNYFNNRYEKDNDGQLAALMLLHHFASCWTPLVSGDEHMLVTCIVQICCSFTSLAKEGLQESLLRSSSLSCVVLVKCHISQVLTCSSLQDDVGSLLNPTISVEDDGTYVSVSICRILRPLSCDLFEIPVN